MGSCFYRSGDEDWTVDRKRMTGREVEHPHRVFIPNLECTTPEWYRSVACADFQFCFVLRLHSHESGLVAPTLLCPPFSEPLERRTLKLNTQIQVKNPGRNVHSGKESRLRALGTLTDFHLVTRATVDQHTTGT